MTRSLAIFLLFAAALLASAADLEGVTMPDDVAAGGKTLHLNGLGLRKSKVLGVGVKVYVAGLYVEKASHDAASIVSASGVKEIRLSFLRALDKATIGRAIGEAFERNSADAMPALAERLARLVELLTDVDAKGEIVLTCIPGEGTRAVVNGKEAGRIPGDDFARALLLVWLGENPVDQGLKKALLEGPPRSDEPF
jgi:hypothetical protein